MSIAVQLPELGESVVEGSIARWMVKEGDVVAVDQPLVEVTTDKVDAEIPSPVAGIVEKLLVAEGETVPVGTELLRIAEGAEGTQAASSTATAPAANAAPPSPAPATAQENAPAAPPAALDTRVTPTAARFAEAAGVDVSGLTGSGVGGRVTKDDVVDYVATQPAPGSSGIAPGSNRPAPRTSGGATSSAAPTPVSAATQARFGAYTPEEGDKLVPMSPLRRLVAEHMVYSKQTSPHVGTVAEVDMSGVAAVRAANKKRFQEANGIGLTFLPFIVNATVRALREFPALNASVLEDAIVEKRGIHLGIAVETDKGLMVPVIRDADRLSMAGLAAAIDDLSSRARNKKIKADELGGSFTVTNPGRKGNLYGFAIINQPQVGILRMGEMIKRPVVRALGGEDAIVIRPMMHLALSYDHRAVDGAPANGFLFRVRELLEQADFDLLGVAFHPRGYSQPMPLEIEWLGRVPYGEALDIQKAAVEDRRAGCRADRLLLLEHPPVVTSGRSADPANLRFDEAALQARGIELHSVARGGDVTYHAPGQLVGYLILDLDQRDERDVHALLRRIEAALIAALADLGVEAGRVAGWTGVFIPNSDPPRKIASIGIGLRGWVSYHGFALNVDLDLQGFDVIIPCGLKGVQMTSLSAEQAEQAAAVGEIDSERVRALVGRAFQREFP